MYAKATYTLDTQIKDDTFEVDDMHEYILNAQVSMHSFRFCVIDTTRNRCVALEDYKITGCNDCNDLLDVLENIFDENSVLKAGFWKSVKLSFRNSHFSLVPQSLFSENHAKDILGITCYLSDKHEVHYYKHSGNGTVNIFAAEAPVLKWFKKNYPGKYIEVIHHTSWLLEGVKHSKVVDVHTKVYVNVDDELLSISVKRGEEILFINNFQFYSPNDFVYYILFVYNEFDLNPEVIPIILTGNIHKNSENYLKIYRFVRNIVFGKKPTWLKFGYHFDEVSDHRYFELYSAHFC